MHVRQNQNPYKSPMTPEWFQRPPEPPVLFGIATTTIFPGGLTLLLPEWVVAAAVAEAAVAVTAVVAWIEPAMNAAIAAQTRYIQR